MSDAFRLERFVQAQAPIYEDVLAELRGGRKRSHWMWFVFPQLVGLGFSRTAAFFGIGSQAEAVAYTEHALLGSRLRECTSAALAVARSSAREIFGAPDDLKFHSSMTLFAEAAPDVPEFRRALARFFAGEPDANTLRLLEQRATRDLRLKPTPDR